MAFLMTVAASKKGAEDMLDAGIFEQLSMCSFVSVAPMREEIIGELQRPHPFKRAMPDNAGIKLNI
jgi:hypothetical protein